MKVEPMTNVEVQDYLREELRRDFILNILAREAKNKLPHWYDEIVDCPYCPFKDECKSHRYCDKHILNYITKGDINYEHKS